MIIFYIAMFFCCVSMLQGMDSHPQDFQLLKTTAEQNKKKMIDLLENKQYCQFKYHEIGDIVWNDNGFSCGRVMIESTVYGPLIKLKRYQLNENDEIICTSAKWKNFVKFLLFSRKPFFKDNGDFSCYSYNTSPGNGVPLPIVEYSISEKGQKSILLCVIDFNIPCKEYRSANPFFASVGNVIDEDDLLKAILQSPFQEKENTKAYPLADVVFPEYYKPRVRHADIFEHQGEYLFLSKFPPALRLLVKQAIFHQFVCKRLQVAEEVRRLIEESFADV
jgi:hypothetical protein